MSITGSVEQDILYCLRCREQCGKRSGEEFDKKIFIQWMLGVFDEMLCEQKKENVIWTPSAMLTRMGLKINNENSILTLAARHKIPVFCPEITNGLFFGESFVSQPSLILDILGDLKRINSMAMKALNSSIIALGAGVVKHHMCKANCVRDGADFGFYINEVLEFDGSDSGAQPDESVACGKIKITAKPVKIHGDANILFPLIVSQTFVKYLLESRCTKSETERKQ
jgi:deoxyhypusine synthase